MKRQLAAILYADVVGYSRHTRLDEEKTYSLLRDCLDLLSATIAQHEGIKIKEAGDAILAEFQSVVAAVECAIVFQEKSSVRNERLDEDDRLEMRIGVNLGEVIHDREDIYGDGVNVAARIQEHAEPGGICLSGSVYEQIKGKVEHEFSDLGYHKVKNIPQSVRIYRASYPDTGRNDDQLLGWDVNPVETTPRVTGKCMCGSVRYECSEPALTNSYCHCRMCQRANSAPFAAWAVFRQSAVRFPNAEPRYFQSSPFGERGFCSACGSPMTMRFYPQKPDGILAFFAATLDHPEDFAPTYHACIDSKMPWLEIHDDLPRKTTLEFDNIRKRWEAVGIPNPDDWKLPGS